MNQSSQMRTCAVCGGAIFAPGVGAIGWGGPICHGPWPYGCQGYSSQIPQSGGLSNLPDTPKGWECPRCHKIYAPYISHCDDCYLRGKNDQNQCMSKDESKKTIDDYIKEINERDVPLWALNEIKELKQKLDEAMAEIERLRKILKSAPQMHTRNCDLAVGDGDDSCTCWVKEARQALKERK